MSEGTSNTTEAVKKDIGVAKEATKEEAKTVSETAKETAEKVGEKVVETIEEADEYMNDKAKKTADYFGGKEEEPKAKEPAGTKTMKERISELRNKVAEFISTDRKDAPATEPAKPPTEPNLPS